MADYEFSAKLNATGVEQTLRSMEDWVARLTNNSVGSFGRMEKALLEIAKSSKAVETALSKVNKESEKTGDGLEKGSKRGSAGMGVLAGATAAVTNKLIEMGTAAIRGFGEIVKGGIDAAKSLETTSASLTGIFGGDPDLALAALDKIRQESLRLGIDLSELAPSFLPKVENLDQFAKIGELAASLARLDPAQGAAGAKLALNEALSGDVTSLRRRFEIDVTPIQEAQKEFGQLEGLLIGLEQILKERGQDFESLSETAGAKFGILQNVFDQLQTELGQPILDVLKEDASSLIDLFTEELPDGTRKVKDEIVILVQSIGDLLADIADLGGDQLFGFLTNIDLEALQQLILDTQNLIDIIETIRQVADQNPLENLIEGFTGQLPDLFDLQTALTAVVQIMGIINATAAAGIAAVTGYFDILTRLGKGEVNFSDLSEEMENLQASMKEAARDAIGAANEALAEQNTRLEENANRLNERVEAQNESNDSDLAAANAALANKQALEAEAKAAEEAAAAQEKYNDAREDYEIEKERAAQDLALKQQRALLDAEIEFAQKREDIARKNAQAIEDIYRENAQKITDAAVDLRRDEEDIARKNARSQIEIEREAANRKVEIETDYRRELQRIRERFDFDAQEAIRQNDAIAFLRIQRQKDFELQQAQTQRDEEIQDAETSAIEQRQKLQEQLQGQIEDARIANERKLEDLRVSLERELQEQRAKYARDVQEAKIAEDRKRQELARTFQRQQQDFQTYWDRKLQDLIRNYQREIQIIQQYEAQKARIMAESRARARAAAEAASADSVLLQNYGGGPRVDPRAQNEANSADSVLLQNYTGRKFGGYTPAGVDFLVGENGPERLRLPRPGYITSNHNLRFNPSTAGIVNHYTNTRQTNFNVDALMSMLSPQQLAIVQQLVNQLGMSIYK